MSEPTPITDDYVMQVGECNMAEVARRFERTLAAQRAALDAAEQALICDVCLGKPLPSGKNCVCKGTGNLIYTLQGTRENMASEWKAADAQRTALLALSERIRREGMQGVANEIEEIVK